jgi:hypothetical protein
MTHDLEAAELKSWLEVQVYRLEASNSLSAQNIANKYRRVLALIAAARAGVPDGWKLVPVEPSAEQWAEVENNIGPFERGALHPMDFYIAVRDAAPPPPVQPPANTTETT